MLSIKINIILLLLLISSHKILLSASSSSEQSSTIEKLFSRFSDFLTDIKNPNHHFQKQHQDRLKYYESKLTHTRVWLTVSSVVNVTGYKPGDDLLIRAIEIHWLRPTTPNIGDYITIYRQNDSLPIRTYPMIIDNNNKIFPHYYKTDLEFNYQNLTNLNQSMNDNPFDNCLEYIVAYINYQGNIESKNCIRLQARWMENLFEKIKDHRLSELMIPGTHDSSSYEKYSYDTYELDVLNRFQYTQDESIYNQLAYGIRYMDWRVAVYNHTTTTTLLTNNNTNNQYEEFWMVHDIQRNRITLKQALKQVLKFLKRTTHEIIIIDFHRFVHGFDGVNDLTILKKRLNKFIEIIEQHFGSYLIPFNLKGLPTIGNLIAQNKRLLIGYSYKFDLRNLPDSILLWPSVKHLWANTDKLTELEQYIDKNICKSSRLYNNVHLLRSIMAELTPTIEGVLFRRYHGLRELASIVNMNYEQWFHYRWTNCTNIVSADFFLGSDLIDISIDINNNRFQ